jgi:DNA-binding response OmpR family regulator/thioredoxin-like negative regulator of GroEL
MEPSSDDLRQIDIIKIYNTKKCLVIDDFPEIRGSLMRTLKNFGAESVDTAADGDEAVKLCNQNRYDIVICDYNLGMGKDGQQVLEEVRYLRVLLMTSLFVMLTGESSREMVLGALECQPDDYITKPYTEASLRTRLNRALVRHEALLHIKKAISDGDYQKAVDGCNALIKAGSRYASDCIKLKGQLLFLLRQLVEAKQLYESVLDKKPVVWAKLGIGKTLLEMGKLDSAEDILEQLIHEDNRYIEAHDLLAEVFVAKNDMLSAQKAIERASQVSPKSVHRHRKLAELADVNGDDELSAKSHQNAIKWGMNSCYETAQDYFNYARKVSDVVRNSGGTATEGNVMVKQAIGYLDRARKRYGNSPEVEAQSHMVEAQLFHSQGKSDKAKEVTGKAKKLFNDLRSPSVDTSLEFARTLHTMNEEEQARAILTSLAANHPNDKNLLRIIDGITSEPISDDGKVVATKLTKTGINSYEQKDFDTAIEVFNEAIAAYPKHIGLNLNLIQAVLAATEMIGSSPRYEKLCRRSMRAIGQINTDHKQFKRYAFLQKQLSKHYPEVLAVV